MISTRHLGTALLAATLLLAGTIAWRGRDTASSLHSNSSISTTPATPFVSSHTPDLRNSTPDRYHHLFARLRTAASEPATSDLASLGQSPLHRITASLTSADFAALLAQTTPGDNILRLALLLAWTQLDPAAAASSLDSTADPDSHRIVAAAWARQDLPAATTWGRGLPSGPARDEALAGLGHEASLKNSQLAIGLAAELPESPARTEILSQSATTWAVTDPQAALAWARQMPDPALREQLVAGIALSWADQDPYAAADLVLASVGEGSIEENALVGIVQRLAFHDLQSARDWVARFPEGRIHERAQAELTRISERLRD